MRQQSQASTPNILKEIQGGKIYPVYLLCGEEDFLIENALKQMLDTLLESNTRDFNLDLFDGVTVSVRDILTAVEVYPVMSEWRVVVVREPTVFKSKKGPSPVELIQTAADAANENPQKAISVMVKVLGISAQEIVEQSDDFTSTLNEVIEAHGDSLTSEDMAFLKSLPQIAEELDDLPGPSGSSDDTELLIEWLQGTLPEQGVLVLTVNGNVDARSRLVKAIDRVGRYASFAQLEAAQSLRQDVLFQGLSRRLEEYNKKITTGAFNLLRKRTGNDMHIIFEELQKLVAFIGDKPQIDEKDVHNLVVQSTFDNIFALTDAIGKRSVAQALASLHSVLGSGEPPIKVNALIVRQIRLTLQAKLLVEQGALKADAGQTNYRNFADRVFKPLASQVSSLLPKSASINLLKQNPFAAYKIIQSVPNFSTDELIQFLEKTLDADIQLKSSSLDAGVILEQLVYELCTRPKSRRGQDSWGNAPANVGSPVMRNS